jgi:hypothetical protein
MFEAVIEVKQNRNQNTKSDTGHYREVNSEIPFFNHNVTRELSWKGQFMAVGNEKPYQDAKNAHNNKQLAHTLKIDSFKGKTLFRFC